MYAADGTGTLTTPDRERCQRRVRPDDHLHLHRRDRRHLRRRGQHLRPRRLDRAAHDCRRGRVSSASGAVAVAGSTIQWTGLTLARRRHCDDHDHGAVSGGACVAGNTATATSTAGAATWTTTEKSVAGGALTAIASSPSINVYAADGSGTLTTPTANVANAASGQTITFTYTAAAGGISGGAVYIVVPAGWTAPTIANAVGCVSSASGAVAVAGSTIQWTGLTLAGGGTATITYGATSGGSCAAGDTATATGTAGAATWTTTEKSTAGGALTAIGASPSINVYAADGSGTLTTPTTTATAGAGGQTITFTYTAAAGGISGGAVNIVVPAGWTAPTTANAAGCVSSASGAVAISVRTIQWTGLTLAGGATATITYGATSGGSCAGGDSATANSTAGAATWTTTEKSVAGGALTAIGASPSITVVPGAAATLTVTAPANATAGTAFSTTVTALDAFGNTATGYTGTVHFTGGGTGPTLPANYTFVAGDNGTHTFTNGVTLTQAGNQTIAATDTVTGTITGTSGTIAVAATSAAMLTVSAPANATAGTAFTATVTALDTYGNTATGYTGTVHFTSGGTSRTLPANYTFIGGDNGVHTFTKASP